MEDKMRAHIFVEGLVQGVFFRETTRIKAENLRVKGWVRNLEDGRVEAVFEGDRGKVEEIVEWAKKGPSFAMVEGVEITIEKYKGEFEEFEVRYD